MDSSEPIVPFDWQRIWLPDEFEPAFLWEVAFRSIFMYLLILGALRLSGKRGVKQLSLFELTIILGLGSAAGDPMFYHDVPLLHALVVFAVVVSLYLFFNFLTEKSSAFEVLLEGKPVCVLEEGILLLHTFKRENITYTELFGEMRQQQVEHLGQVRKVYLEATGELSIFFREGSEVKPGMPIFPEIFSKPFIRIERAGNYACGTCGLTQNLTLADSCTCPNCGKDRWLDACTAKRTT